MCRRVDVSHVGTAGIKDKWGITSQRISIYNVKPTILVQLSKKSRRIALGNFTYATRPLVIGDLLGNHFRILLLNVRSQNNSISSINEVVDKAVTSLKEFGFINYFGLQRFSFGYHKNQIVGKTILQMNWEKVINIKEF